MLILTLLLGAQTTLQVNQYDVGDGPADLVSVGVPFKPGELPEVSQIHVLDGTTELQIATKRLASWAKDGSVRVALVQFLAPTPKALTLSTAGGVRTQMDRALVPVTWRYPKRIATLPAAWLSSSLVMWQQKPLGTTGEAAWDDLQVDNFTEIDTEPDPAVPCARTDQYYDSANSSYGVYVRTGDIQYLTNGRRWAYHHGRHQVHLTGPDVGHGICSGGYVNNTRYTFVDSLVRDYFFWGDEESLRVAGLVVDNFYMPHADSWYYKAPNTRGFWTEREAAFAQLGLIAYYEATLQQAYLDTAKARVHSLQKMQVDNGNRAWVHNLYDHDPTEGCGQSDYGSSSFMSGLLFESLIRYHQLSCDPVAAESLRLAVDDLRAKNVATGDYAGRSLIYLGCPQTNASYVDGSPDLDNLAAHGWAYAYRLSGFTSSADRDFALALFRTAVEDGYVGAPKQYNQAFRSSGHVPAYLDPMVPDLGCGGATGSTGSTGAMATTGVGAPSTPAPAPPEASTTAGNTRAGCSCASAGGIDLAILAGAIALLLLRLQHARNHR